MLPAAVNPVTTRADGAAGTGPATAMVATRASATISAPGLRRRGRASSRRGDGMEESPLVGACTRRRGYGTGVRRTGRPAGAPRAGEPANPTVTTEVRGPARYPQR